VNDGQDIRIDIVEPGRAYNQGYLQVADLPDVSEIEIGVQALLDNLLTIE